MITIFILFKCNWMLFMYSVNYSFYLRILGVKMHIVKEYNFIHNIVIRIDSISPTIFLHFLDNFVHIF